MARLVGSLDVKLGSILCDTLQCLSQSQVQNSNTNHFSLICTRFGGRQSPKEILNLLLQESGCLLL